jgi:hypothetical protein
MPAVVVNPRTIFKYGADNAYGGGELAVLDIINVQSVVVNLEEWHQKHSRGARSAASFAVLFCAAFLPSSLCFLLSEMFNIIVMLRFPVPPRSSLSSLLYPTSTLP